MKGKIAIIGIACRYPDACTPQELWENVLAQRRSFRAMPAERMCAGDFWSPDPRATDRSYAMQAAVIEGYRFDRVAFRVSGSTYRQVDLAHWLALDVAAQALADGGFPDGEGLPRETTGVLVGNTLTGEFSRAGLLRLRWPYVRRVLEPRLVAVGWPAAKRRAFLHDLEARYKAPFPEVGEESLAGGLSNTIGGRICNYFNLQGGGYTVDGACASSLLAVTSACSALIAEDLDVALAGGVDLSLDPFEIVGFAKVEALAPEEMRVYDARSAGFWPGEGCGFVLLMRAEDALAQGRRIYGLIRGWGVSSDGSGGMTRPTVSGQKLALQRAYLRARLPISEVALFEGHGTGTAVGDAIELQTLSAARREADPDAPPAAIGSIKANIGHTKAAAGVAGLLKAVMALQAQVLPPTTGCETPHPELTAASPALEILRVGRLWPADRRLAAGVSAMGFGGINTHVILESTSVKRRNAFNSKEKRLLAAGSDTELFLFAGDSRTELQAKIGRVSAYADRLSRAELVDLAGELSRHSGGGPERGAVVAATPEQLAGGLHHLEELLRQDAEGCMEPGRGVFLGTARPAPRVAFLFSGQGSPIRGNGGAWARRFAPVAELYARADLPPLSDGVSTAIAQPSVVAASVAGLQILDRLGVAADAAVGHSLGELTALHWAGAMDRDALLDLAIARGAAMQTLGRSGGAMAALRAGGQEVAALLADLRPAQAQAADATVMIAGLNGPRQTVVSGAEDAVAEVVQRAGARGWQAVMLPVSHAFHTEYVAPALPALRDHLARMTLHPLRGTVGSTVSGGLLAPEEDLRALLCRQVTAPVRFADALAAIAAVGEGLDLLIEVGPGRVIADMARESVRAPVLALDSCGESLRGLCNAIAAAFVLGAAVDHEALVADRPLRPFSLDWDPQFFVNPCELPPRSATEEASPADPEPSPPDPSEIVGPAEDLTGLPPLDLVLRLVAARAELPVGAVNEHHRMLSDLHLNSLTVSQLVVEAARLLELPPPPGPTDLADATVAQIAAALDGLRRHGPPLPAGLAEEPAGVAPWTRFFTVEEMEQPRSTVRPAPRGRGKWHLLGAEEHSLHAKLRTALPPLAADGVLLCLPARAGEDRIVLLLEAARAASAQGVGQFVLVQEGGRVASFARTLHLEMPAVATCVLDLPVDHPQAAAWIASEIEATPPGAFREVRYDRDGRRRIPLLHPVELGASAVESPLTGADLLVVSGGGKGITAECALALARETGVRLALLGRSEPADDSALAANLLRIREAGVACHYVRADLTDPAAVRGALREITAQLGPVTGVLHGAGTNQPCLLNKLDEDAFRETVANKVGGLRNLLAAIDADRLRLLITFGSIIARTGMRGEADYAVANEWLAAMTEDWRAEHAHCRCLTIEWSAWSGIGMAERLGSVASLKQEGVSAISPAEGVARFLELVQGITGPGGLTRVVVAGRIGRPPTVDLAATDLPLLRFLERPRVHYPGVELVVEADLSPTTDPYLADHVVQGEPLLPGVLALEAMAQVASALVGGSDPPQFTDVQFARPVFIRPEGKETIRLAALRREGGGVEVVLRCGSTAYQADHFRATCFFGAGPAEGVGEPLAGAPEKECLELDPQQDLYGSILFHRGRFQRLVSYRRLEATACLAELRGATGARWFGHYLPPTLLLGDPGVRDAALHAVQACIPHATLLPVGVDHVWVAAALAEPQATVFVHARERGAEAGLLTYDLDLYGADGRHLESWRGLRLRPLAGAAPREIWVTELLGTYLERRIHDLVVGCGVRVVLARQDGRQRRAAADAALQRALGAAVGILRRPDGKPEADNGRAVSAAHAADLTLAVAGEAPLGCDLEAIESRPATLWRDLLGADRCALAELLAAEQSEDHDTAATRVWAAAECVKKAGAAATTPLILDRALADRWVVFRAGADRVATYVTGVQELPGRLVVAVLARERHESL